MATETDIAWAAGLFEGEGCISVFVRRDRGTQRVGVSLTLGTTDLDVLERFISIVGVGASYPEAVRSPKHKQAFRWQIANARQVERILDLLLPHFGERRTAKAKEALAASVKIGDHRGPKRPEKCRNGHPFLGDNIKFLSSGRRRCRTCLNAWRRANEKKTSCG